MRYKAVLFDMDGTVLNTLGDLTAAVNHTMEEFSLPLRTETEVASFLGSGARYLISHAAPEGTPPERLDTLLRFYSPWYESHCAVLTAPYEGIIPLMRELKALGVKQAVISNKQDAAVKPLAAQYFPGLLDLAVGESPAVRRKPAPDTVLAALAAMGVDGADAIYVGDTEVDIETARNAGIDCAVVGWGFRSREHLTAHGAGHIFASPEELRLFLTQSCGE